MKACVLYLFLRLGLSDFAGLGILPRVDEGIRPIERERVSERESEREGRREWESARDCKERMSVGERK